MIARIFILFFLTISLQASTINVYAADKPEGVGDHNIPYKRASEVGTGISVLRVVFGLSLVLALGFGAIFAIRRYLPASYGATVASASRHIDLVEMRRLTPRLTLFLLNIDGEKIVLAQTSETLTMHGLHSGTKEVHDAA